jgi:hypothetical protein
MDYHHSTELLSSSWPLKLSVKKKGKRAVVFGGLQKQSVNSEATSWPLGLGWLPPLLEIHRWCFETQPPSLSVPDARAVNSQAFLEIQASFSSLANQTLVPGCTPPAHVRSRPYICLALPVQQPHLNYFSFRHSFASKTGLRCVDNPFL